LNYDVREISNLRLLCAKKGFKTFEEAFEYSQIILDHLIAAPRNQIFDENIYFLIREGLFIPGRAFVGHTKFGLEFEIVDLSRSKIGSFVMTAQDLSITALPKHNEEDRPFLVFKRLESGPEVRFECFLTN